MDYLSIDFETRSTADLRNIGVYKYAEDDSTDIWCMAWAIGDEEPELWRPGDPVPEKIKEWVGQGNPCRAWNAQFERTVWNKILVSRYGFPITKVSQWFCTAAEARAMSLPGSLGEAAIVLGVEQQKDQSGSRLMLQMARPRKVLPDGRIEWWATPDKMKALFSYCLQDVRTERSVFKRIRVLPERERQIFIVDQKINDRGVLVDLELVKAAEAIADEGTRRANQNIKVITKGHAKSVTDIRGMIDWMSSQGVETESLDKKSISMLKQKELPDVVRKVLTIREESAKTSVKKIKSMLGAAGEDGRIRGTLLFHGASTGRWSGRLVQPQNFPRGTVPDVERFIPDVLAGDYDAIDLHHPPLEVVSSMLRSMFISGEQNDLVASDFSAIEARVTAWFANEQWRLDVFKTHGRIYEASAAMMFNVPVEKIVKGQPEYSYRQRGKVAELALGFQGGVGAMKAMGAAEMGLSQEEMQDIVNRWRSASPSIVLLWKNLEDAAMSAIKAPGYSYDLCDGKIEFKVEDGFLWMRLPSGRKLAYYNPKVVERETPWGTTQDSIQVYGMNSVTRKWQTTQLYGGILTENVVQATAADLLFEAVINCEEAGMPVILTVHDEIVCEVPKARASAVELERLMSICPRWAEGLPLASEGWAGSRYRK